jgi:hypothetical protein
VYGRWISACAIAEAIGIGVAGLVAIVLAAALGAPETAAERGLVLGAMVAAGSIEGLALGALQWSVLRERLPGIRFRAWVGATVAVAALGWLIGMAGPTFAADDAGATADEPTAFVVIVVAALIGAAAGAVFGGAQWLVLRRHAPRAWRWVAINVPAWAVAMAAIFAGATAPAPGWPAWAIAGSAVAGGLGGGAALGAITGVVARTLRPMRV